MGHMKTLTINGQTFNVVSPTPVASVALKAEAWVGSESPYLQVVTLPGVTPRSKVNLQPSAEQLEVFREKDLGFTTKNAGGVVTAYAVGVKPQNDYTMQVTVEEVSEQYAEQGTAIWGDTVGTPLSPDKIASELAPLNVIISGNDTDGYTANATHSDIEDYYSVGRYAHCSLGDLVLPLVSWNQGKAVFAAIVEGREIRVEIDRDNNVSVSRVAGGGSVEIDKTLTKEGAAADAKAVGDAIAEVPNTVYIDVRGSFETKKWTPEDGAYDKALEYYNKGYNVVCRLIQNDDGEPDDHILLPFFGHNSPGAGWGLLFTSLLDTRAFVCILGRDSAIVELWYLPTANNAWFPYISITNDAEPGSDDFMEMLGFGADTGTDSDGNELSAVRWNGYLGDGNVQHKGVADGIEDNDAVNVKQLNEALANLPAGDGSGEKWELLHDVVLEEAVSAKTGMEFATTGSKELIVEWYCPKADESCGYATFKLNGNKPGGGCSANQSYFWSGNLTGTSATYHNFRIEALGDSAVISAVTDSNKNMNAHWWDGKGLYNTIDAIALTHYSGTYPAGLKFRIWGRK